LQTTEGDVHEQAAHKKRRIGEEKGEEGITSAEEGKHEDVCDALPKETNQTIVSIVSGVCVLNKF
jgi:hypothetical protein